VNTKKNKWPVTPAGKGLQVMLPTGADGALEAHYVDAGVTNCSCHRGARCPALREVQTFLAGGTNGEQVTSEKHDHDNGGNGQLPATCPICGTAVHRDYFGGRRGWRCEQGGLTHYYQARYQHLQSWFTRPASERWVTLATPAEQAAMALTYPASA